ncbi:hypothetical protein [Azospirillum argentinense]|uniref:hypothetical protein n=1 Tax=Azospirillum argentinense TaxID=2970906 RepID=UPI0032DE61C9
METMSSGAEDVAIVWGPASGPVTAHCTGRQPVPLALHTHLAARQGPLFPTVFDISMGLSPGKAAHPNAPASSR